MKARELRELGTEELDVRIRERAKELADMRLKHKSGVVVEKPVRMRGMRKEIARMKTVQNQQRRAK
jgi:large subunit ribosomal protein L29